MDELELLRDLGRELEHEPPGLLPRQRRRLLDAAGAAGAAGAVGAGVPGASSGTGVPRGRRLRGSGRWTLIGAVAAVTAALVLVPALVLRGGGPSMLGGQKRPSAGTSRALNILLVGSDSRGPGPARSDTLVLVHLAAGRKDVRAVSIPRDTVVQMPPCEVDGKVVPSRTAQINTAYSLGIACAHETVESVTGVPIDTSVVIDFAGFQSMVDALGGVEVTIPQPVHDPASGLSVRAGRQRLDGGQALAYARSRHGLGDGSDLSRIRRQQALMAALMRESRSQRLRNPMRYAKFLAVAARSVATHPRLDLGALEAVARGLEKTAPGGVRFTTVPVRPAPQDRNRLVIDRPAAERLFERFRR